MEYKSIVWVSIFKPKTFFSFEPYDFSKKFSEYVLVILETGRGKLKLIPEKAEMVI